MAHITFIEPVKSVSGKLSKASTLTFMLRRAATANARMLSNPNYTHIMGKRKSAPSQSEIDARTRFGKICKATAVRLNDVSLMSSDVAAFRAQSQYSTLRHYVWHQCANQIA